MSEEKPLLWVERYPDDDKPEKIPSTPAAEEKSINEFKRANKRQRGLIVIGLAVMWLLGEAGCLLAGMALHETVHF